MNLYYYILGGFPSIDNKFVFNGDLVDRGSMSTEIVIVLLLMKLIEPHSITILRGNHETTAMNEHYGFEKEVLTKYNKNILNDFRLLFDCLPLAAILENKIFVVHGGLGPKSSQMSINELNKLNRFQEPDFKGFIYTYIVYYIYMYV